jgi:hypothetical protein
MNDRSWAAKLVASLPTILSHFTILPLRMRREAIYRKFSKCLNGFA